jgi:transcriptional regulator with XRE-family HTH domain
VEVSVIFTNILWALKQRRLTQYALAAEIRIERSRFSRGMNGLIEFTPLEREHIAEALGYSEDWLFSKPVPPRTAIR